MIYNASAKELARIRKYELIRLFNLAQLIGDADSMTKPDLVNALMSAREETVDFPPSSPRAESSDDPDLEDGNAAGDEETDFAPPRSRLVSDPPGLRRRATVAFNANQVDKSREHPRKRPNHAARSASLGYFEKTWPGPMLAMSPPPAARTRSHKISGDSSKLLPPVQLSTRKKTKQKAVHVLANTVGDSDLATLTESEDAENGVLPIRRPPKGQVSPRRTRSRSQTLSMILGDDIIPEVDDTTEAEDEEEADCHTPLPITPKRTKAPVERRTPLRKRLRPRRTQTFTPPSDGDGDDEAEREAQTKDSEAEDVAEDSAEEDGTEEDGTEEDGTEEDGTEEDAEEEQSNLAEDVESFNENDAYDPTPRKLRSGRIVGEDLSVELSEASDTSLVVTETEASDGGLDDQDEGDEPEANEDDDTDDIDPEAFDLHNATMKTLLRLRRADLVHMCAARELDMIGTKPQLSKRLIDWRNSIESTNPTSTATAREAPRTARQPILLHSHVHVSGPCTPPLSPAEAEIELDLESLGLEDREIPPERLTKLDKIGSGGFKDVYVGKWRSKRVAISEFRGTLTSSKSDI